MGEEQWQHKQASFIRIYSQRGGDQELVLGPVLKITLLRWFIKQKHNKKNGANFFFFS